jgi:ribosomal protein S18 acetylase RimI-like enzyme
MDKNSLTGIAPGHVCLHKASKLHIAELQRWFTSEQSMLMWGGPALSYPSSELLFYEQLTSTKIQSFSLVLHHQLLGFGQYQLLPPFMHLGRLVINPQFRRLGLSSVLVRRLIESACALADLSQASLFVYESNYIAKRVYLKEGFKESTVPNGVKQIEGCNFLTLLFD